MKIKNSATLFGFFHAIDRCKGDVYLVSQFGDKYNLKSELTKYIAIGELLKDNEDNLELFCEYKEDESIIMEFFENNPDVLK